MKLTKKEKEYLKEAIHVKKVQDKNTATDYYKYNETKEKAIDRIYTAEKLEKKLEVEKTEEKA